MKRKAITSLTVDPNVRCKRIFPVEGSKKQTDELQTVGITLTKEQAVHLARVLLAATQEWNTIDITAFRFEKRREDGTYRVTVTSKVINPSDPG
jgi:hypothetical protein